MELGGSGGTVSPLAQMHKKIIWMKVCIYSVKAKSQAGNTWVKDLMATQKDQCWKKISLESKNLHILLENSAENLGSRR